MLLAAVRLPSAFRAAPRLLRVASRRHVKAMASSRDPSSLSTPDVARVTHSDLALRLDFEARRISGVALLSVQLEAAGASELVLDTRTLSVCSAWLVTTEEATPTPLAFSLDEPRGVLGSALRVALPAGGAVGDVLRVAVAWATSPDSTACQWLSPAQTAGGKQPYMFTQCQAIHARALLPCQDTPGAKMTYSAAVTVGAGPLTALMSALPVDAPTPGLRAAQALATAAFSSSLADSATFFFEQRVPLAPYLVGLAAGELVSRELGPRSRVWSEPCVVDAAAFEFAETPAFLEAAESLAGPYAWGRYDMLLLPPSYPYGGMEHPNMTFLTPTLLAEDRSLANVVAHELAHSWTGNLVTNKDWADFWLNEGWTVFLERKILQRLRGDATWSFHAAGGWRSLKQEVARLGEAHAHTRLVQDMSGGADPDDSFSRVPYEKGFAFLVHLERCAGGPAAFEPFMRDYLASFAFGTVTSEQFKQFFTQRFPDASAAVDWHTWLHAPGMPPVDVSASYDNSLRAAADALAQKWCARDLVRPRRPAPASAL